MKTKTELLPGTGNMKEYELDQEFTHEGKRLKCVKGGETGCNSCYLERKCARGIEKSSYIPFHLFCMGKYRSDGLSVKFIACQSQK